MKEQNVMVLGLSGGIDSTIGLEYLRQKYKFSTIIPIYVNLNTKYSKEELKCLHKLEKLMDFKLKVVEGIDLEQFESGSNAFIYCRNLILACLAGNYGNQIVIFGILGDKVSDKNKKIFKKMSEVISEAGGKKVEIMSPFWNMTKSQIISWFLNNYKGGREKAIQILRTSISCYTPVDGKSCGNCNSCLRKGISLEANNINFVGWFVNDIKGYLGIRDYIKKMKRGEYDRERTKESLEVFKKWGWKV